MWTPKLVLERYPLCEDAALVTKLLNECRDWRHGNMYERQGKYFLAMQLCGKPPPGKAEVAAWRAHRPKTGGRARV
jgi:hypothetical protein